jgi:hypothetical protein
VVAGDPEDPVGADDVVVLHDRPAPEHTQALRELGAHVVWRIARRPPEPARAVVHNDRDETVGGTRHARPVVAPR